MIEIILVVFLGGILLTLIDIRNELLNANALARDEWRMDYKAARIEKPVRVVR
jgi:hypothetical protein